MNTTFYITSWNFDEFDKLKQELIFQGIDCNYIKWINDRTSRSISINKAWRRCETKYLCLMDADIKLCPRPFLQRMESILDQYAKVGAVVIPCYQFKEIPEIIQPELPENHPIEKSLSNLSSDLRTFNCILIRAGVQSRMDEDIWGNQNLDVDFGLSLLKEGFITVADLTLALGHLQTDYISKNLFYHAAVCRNRQIFKTKWSNIDDWFDVEAWNEKHNNEIPSVEELAHCNEDKLIAYISRFDKFGLVECFLKPRTNDIHLLSNYLLKIQDLVSKNDYEFEYSVLDGYPKFT